MGSLTPSPASGQSPKPQIPGEAVQCCSSSKGTSLLRLLPADNPGATPSAPSTPQCPQYSRFQCCEKWVWLRDILELSALVSAQPDDVTQGLGSVGLPLETGTGAASAPGPSWECTSWDQSHSCSTPELLGAGYTWSSSITTLCNQRGLAQT